MANLSSFELLKPGREYRAEVILKKLHEGLPFEVIGNKKVIFYKNNEAINLLEKGNKISFDAVRLLANDGNIYKISDLIKTSEFGGKGEGSGTTKEDAQLLSLKNQIALAKKEMKSAIVPVKIKNKVYMITDAASTAGTPKSDFHLLDAEGNEVVWISHKDGSGPKDFQQWGGISEKKEPKIFNHPETKSFIEDLKKLYPKGLPNATSLYRKITDKNLKMLSVYGNAFNSNKLGQQNVSILLQGPVKLIKFGGNYTLSATNIHYNGDSVDNDGFEPVLMAIYKGDRSDAGVKGTRIVIMPILGRKASPF